MKPSFQTLSIIACFFIAAGCSSQTRQKDFTDKKLIIASKETVKIKELDLTITNNGCGRKWIVEGEHPAFEKPYCELVIKYKDSTINAGNNFDPVYLNNIEIDIDRMNPWGVTEDSVPPGGIRVLVRKSQAFTLLETYGWTPEKILNVTEIDFPDTIQGIPWIQYESAAQKIGYDLSKLAGGNWPILKIQLKEKGKRSGTNVWAHIVMDGGESITGWLSVPGMVPGLAPLNHPKDKMENW